MDATIAVFSLYIPYCKEKDGLSHQLATALSLERGKHLCLQHFVHRCRTLLQLLPSEQRMQLPVSLLDSIRLEWQQDDAGIYTGQSATSLPEPLAEMARLVYQLSPAAP